MVNFGDFLKTSAVSKHTNFYIPYDKLKAYLENGMKARKVEGGKHDFYRDLEFSYSVCRNYASEWLARIEGANGIGSDKECIYSPEVIADILDLNQFVYLNQEAVRKIIKKHDKTNPRSRLHSAWSWKMDFNLGRRIIDAVFKVMKSKPKSVTEPKSVSEHKSVTEPAITPTPSSLSMKSIHDDGSGSYAPIVDQEGSVSARKTEDGQRISRQMRQSMEAGNKSGKLDQSDIELGSISSSSGGGYEPPMPVVPVPKLVKQTDSFVRQSTKYWVRPNDLAAVCTVLSEHLNLHAFGSSPWTPISSVYLDSMSFNCYQSRIVKEQGARIIRLRTYDGDTSKIYVERKVHHEFWTGDSSSKDRFVVPEQSIMAFLRGIKVPPNKDNLTALRNELCDMVLQYKLFPVVRVDYTRVAFQPENHDHVRVSIDFNMSILKEKAAHTEWRTPPDRVLEQDLVHFPYAVVEVKLREPYISTPPKWLEDLEASSLLHKENNFSKYVHAVYTFQDMESNPMKLRKPVWWNSQEFTSPQLAVLSDNEITEQKKREDHRHQIHWFAKLLGLDPNVDDDGRPARIEPKTFFACERTFLTWFNSALFIGSIGVALLTINEGVADCLIAVSCLIIVYALSTYWQRTRSLLNKRPSGYHDRYGPFFLATIVLIVFLVAPIITSGGFAGKVSKG